MSTNTRRFGHRRLFLVLVGAMLATLIVAVPGATPAAADEEVVSFELATSSTPEGADPVINVVLDYEDRLRRAITVELEATPGTASSDDYSLGSTEIRFPRRSPPGAMIPVELSFVPDEVFEDDEAFTLTIVSTNTGDIGPIATHTATIINDDEPPTVSVADVSVAESAGSATFTVTRSGPTAVAAQVDVATADITATADADYTAQSTTLTLPPAGPSATRTFTVPISDDRIDEDTEAFAVTLSNPVRATVLDAPATGTIIDDDTALIDIDVEDGLYVLEGDSSASFEVELESEPAAAVAVTFTTDTSQLAVEPPVLIFDEENWENGRTVMVTALEDGIDETDPHFSSIVINTASDDPNYQGIVLPNIVVTIGDADALLVTIDGPEVGAVGRTSTFNAMVNAGGTGTITYDWKVFSETGPLVAEGDRATFEFTPTTGGGFFVQVIVGDTNNQNPAQFIEFVALTDLSSSVFGDDIVWLGNAGITKGCNPPINDEFCPTAPVTREQMAAFLVRFLGLSDDGGGNTFTDDNGSVFEADIAKLAAAGITKGCNPPANTHFCPKAPITRGQMAALLVRALELTDEGGGNIFVDDNGSVFEDAIAKLAAAGITRGCNPPTNDRFCPDEVVTREQMAAFLHRAEDIPNP